MKKRVILMLAAMALIVPASVDAQTMATDDPVLSQIWDLAMNQSRIEPMAQTLLDSIGPRLTGSPHRERAQDWAATMLSSWGDYCEAGACS